MTSAATAANVNLKQYDEMITLRTDGTAQVRIRVMCGDGCPRDLRLPYLYKKPTDLKAMQGEVHGSITELPAQVVDDNGVQFLLLRNVDAANLKQPLIATFTIANYLDWKKAAKEGLYYWSHDFANTIPMAIDKYSMDLVIPKGFVVQSIERSRPALTSKDAKSPYRLFNADGQEHATLNADKGVKTGRDAMLEISFRSDQKSPMLLGFMALLACGYLVYFRDLLTQAKAMREQEKAAP